MLTEIRDRSSGVFSWVIAALIIIPMAFWGVQEYANPAADLTVAEIGEQKISQNEFQVALSNEQQRMRQALGDQVNSDMLNSDGFKQRVLQQLVNRALVVEVANEQNYRVGDEQLAELIKESDLFQADGKFDQTAYEAYLQGSFYSKSRYEEELRTQARLRQVTSGYEESALVLPDEVRSLLEIQAELRTFDLVSVKQQDYVKGITVTDDEVADYFAGNQQQFMQPERVSVSYLELTLDQFAATAEVNEEELRAIYEQNEESFVSQEKRETRHILLSTNDDQDEDAQLAKANELVAELRAGADFTELAKANSDDTGSGARGGSLGLVERGQMVPEFEEATFAAELNAISDPVKSQFGYHIIQVQKIDVPAQQPFEEVRFDLEQDERQRIAEETLLEKVDQLRDLAYEQPESLDAAAEELQLEVRKTPLFDRNNGIGLATNPTFRNQAFSEEILVDEINSEPLEVAEGHFVVLRKLAYEEAKPKELASVSEQIKSILVDQKATTAAELAGQSLIAKANADWAALSGEEGVVIASYTVSLVDSDRKVNNQILEKVTSMQLLADEPTVDSVTDAAGDFHIVRLTKVAPGDLDSVSEQIKESTRRMIAQRNGQSLVGTYLETLRESLVPQVNNDLL